jgi:hypothetical protein
MWYKRQPMIQVFRAFMATVLSYSMVLSSAAQTMAFPFPPSPTTVSDAQLQFDTRATAVIESNACGREDDYLQYRNEMNSGNFENEGENLAHILLAKIAFIRVHALHKGPFKPLPSADFCTGQMFRPHPPNNSDGLSLAQFAAADAKNIAQSSIGCIQIQSVVQQFEQGLANGVITVPEGLNVHLIISMQCMSTEVNEAILAMRKTTNMGTSGLPCLTALSTGGKGEFDVVVRELVRILYLGGPGGILEPRTIDHMYHDLLAARGALSDDSYSLIVGCTNPAGDETGSPEDTADRHAWYKDLARDLGDFFEWALITYLTYVAFPGGGALIAAPFLIAGANGDLQKLVDWDVRVPESENHRLNIETSRYLTNAAIIKHLEAEDWEGTDDVRDDQAGVHDWLLQRLQDIAANDFKEYNARPYSRYSLNSVLNLFDFAAINGDQKLATAAGIVVDLSAAKFAATSNLGRRIVPFRRLSEADGDDDSYLFATESNGDYEIARAMLLSGQIQNMDSNRLRSDQLATLSELVNPLPATIACPQPSFQRLSSVEPSNKPSGMRESSASNSHRLSRSAPAEYKLGLPGKLNLDQSRSQVWLRTSVSQCLP